jgi:hypothetical protein
MSDINIVDDWYRYVLYDGAREDHPGVYEWVIDTVGCYVGRFSAIGRPRKRYTRNLRHQLAGRPYHIHGRPYRLIHRAQYEAFIKGIPCTLYIRENIAPYANRSERDGLLNDLERVWIDLRRREASAGGLPVLNGN